MTDSAGTTTSTAGATTFADFDGLANTAIGTVSGGVPSSGTNPGGGGNWLSATSSASIAVDLTGLADYFGFLWGSRDGSSNQVDFFNGATNVGTFSSTASGFANFTAGGPTDFFDRIVLSATISCCFETDNYAARLVSGDDSPSIPEPGTLTLLGVGLAGLGYAIRRRRQAA